MTSTTIVGPDVATRHILVVTDQFATRSRAGYAAPPTPKGFVLIAAALGQTNIYHGQGPRHPSAVLIEHETAKPGDILSDADVAAGMAAAKAKQDAVPGQIAAREAQAKAARAAMAPPLTNEQHAALLALLAEKSPAPPAA